MFTDLLSSALQLFIREHEHSDVKDLVLKHKTILGIPSNRVADQISGRKKAKEKLPSFYQAEDIVYPPGLNLEQCSSEQTAAFKTSIIERDNQLKGQSIVDLTGGFGVDSFSFSKVFKSVQHVEPNLELLQISKHNHQQLGANNIQYHNTTAEEFLKSTEHKFDFAFIDPSRRAKGNQKVYSLSDCEPDITTLQDLIFTKTANLLVKASPLLDIQIGLKELKFVKKVFIVSVANECKELLFLCEKDFNEEPELEAVNLHHTNSMESFTFQFSEERTAEISFVNALTYLYEPNASILKAGAFKTVSKNFNIGKLHPSTHLYSSDLLVENFPGRTFKVEAFVKADPKTLKDFFPEGKANITTRNYPLSVEELKKKTGLKDGGDKFLIGFSGTKAKYLVVATRIRK